jgi:hypothetical protein
MVQVYEQGKAAYQKDPKKDVVVSIGFHQETAARFLPTLTQALDGIFTAAAMENVPIESVTSETLSAPLLLK